MRFPRFQSGQSVQFSARELNDWSRATETLWNDYQRRRRTPAPEKVVDRAIVRTCAMWKKYQPDPDFAPTQLWVRRVGYSKEPPQVDGSGPYIWVGEPFLAYPDFGKKLEDYRTFEPSMNEPPSPTKSMTFLHVQAESYGWVAWFPVAAGSPIFHAVVRDVGDGFSEIIKVQRVVMSKGGDYSLELDDDEQPVLIEVLVPPDMLSRDFRAMLVPMQFGFHHGINVIKVYIADGMEYAEQTTKFTLQEVDPGYGVTDCVLQAMGGG